MRSSDMIQNSEVKIAENTVDGRNPAPVDR